MYRKLAGLTLAVSAAAFAQTAISARSGMIHYTEGDVTLNGESLHRKSTEFPALKTGEELGTEDGRVELLLSPGVFLRMAEHSGVRMISNDLLNTKLELIGGSALLEVGDIAKDQALAMTVNDQILQFSRKGLYRLDFEPARLRVYDGSATVLAADGPVSVKEGREAELSGTMKIAKFDKDDEDSFYRWASRRSGYISMANVAAARRAHDSQSSFLSSSWVYNPSFGMFTFLPYTGMYRSPFGYSYYSPFSVMNAYYRPAPVIWSRAPMGSASENSSFGSPMRGAGSGMAPGAGNMSSGGGRMAPPAASAGHSTSSGGGFGGGGGGLRGGGGGGSSRR